MMRDLASAPEDLVEVIPRLRIFRNRWVAFHADTGSQLIIAQILVGVPALYLLVDAVVRWSATPVPILMKILLTLGVWAGFFLRLRSFYCGISKEDIVVVCVLLTGSFLFLASFYDTSWDGTSYHLPASLAIYAGWNPIYGKSVVSLANLHANGIWTIRAALYALFATVEGAKVFNVALLLAALFSLCAAFTALLGRPLRALELGLVYALVSNPVATAQIPTFYVDGNVFSLGVVTITATLLIASSHRRIALGLLAAATVLLLGAKITAAVFALVLPAAAALSIWRRVSSWRIPAVVMLSAYALGTVVIGFRPYITNPLEYGHLVELGPGSNVGRPDRLAHTPPPVMLLASVFSRTDDYAVVRLKWPFLVSRIEMRPVGSPGPRVGGFGPFFALELCLSLAAAGVAFLSRGSGFEPVTRPFFVLAGLLALICAVFPEPWAARYVPFFWMVPGLIAFAVCASANMPALSRFLVAAVLVLALLNGGLAFAGNAARTVLGDWRTRVLLKDLASRQKEILIVPIPNRSFEITAAHRLTGMNIPYKIIEPILSNGSLPNACATVVASARIYYCTARP